MVILVVVVVVASSGSSSRSNGSSRSVRSSSGSSSRTGTTVHTEDDLSHSHTYTYIHTTVGLHRSDESSKSYQCSAALEPPGGTLSRSMNCAKPSYAWYPAPLIHTHHITSHPLWIGLVTLLAPPSTAAVRWFHAAGTDTPASTRSPPPCPPLPPPYRPPRTTPSVAPARHTLTTNGRYVCMYCVCGMYVVCVLLTCRPYCKNPADTKLTSVPSCAAEDCVSYQCIDWNVLSRWSLLNTTCMYVCMYVDITPHALPQWDDPTSAELLQAEQGIRVLWSGVLWQRPDQSRYS